MYWSRGLFLWMVQHKSRFRNLKRVDGTTQEFVHFQVCKFQSCLLAKYFILANNCSWSHSNFGQTGGDLSFGVPESAFWTGVLWTWAFYVRNSSLGLCIGVEAYFYGWCNANPDFGIWSEEMAQLKSLCLAGTSGLEIPILPTGQILRLGKYLRLLTHKLRPDSWGETEKPLLCRVLVSPLERG